MNTTAECAPGSWHRIHAFWFMRFNPGQMGIGDPDHEEMGDTLVHSDSAYWSEGSANPILQRVADGGTYPDDLAMPHMAFKEFVRSDKRIFVEPDGAAENFLEGRSRYAEDDLALGGSVSEGHGHTFTNAAFDVDGLDQFGIWFRDDSNYSDFCLSQSSIKPTFTVMNSPQTSDNAMLDYQTNTNTINLSIGCRLLRRGHGYIPASGEKSLLGSFFIPASPALMTSVFPPDPGQALRHYPGNILDSTVDDFIFGYGADISIPYVSDTTSPHVNLAADSSYFRGLFHNAYWLANKSFGDDPYNNRHADEVRYDIRDQPALTLNLGVGLTPEGPMLDGADIMHMGSRIYFPRDTLITPEDEYNHSDLRFDIYEGSTHMTSYGSSTHSDNHQDHFFEDFYATSETDLFVQFQYTGMKRKLDNTIGTRPVVMMSTIYNYLQDQSTTPDNYPTFDQGDSFTNIPYIQEFSVRYDNDPSGIQIVNYSEGGHLCD